MDTLALRFRLGIEVLPLTHLVTIATGDAAGTPAAPGTQLTLGTSLLGRLIAIPPGIWLQILKLLWLPHGPTLTTHLSLALTFLILLHIAIVDLGKFRLLVDTPSVLHANATFGGAVAPAGPRMGETLPRHILVIVGWVKE